MNDRVKTRETMKSPSVRLSIKFALDGIAHALYTERNLRIHVGTTMLGCLVCMCIHPQLWIAVVGICVGLIVISFELVNTAVENLTDMATTGQRHPLAKVAKDTAAGAVLCASFGAVVVGVYLAAMSFPWSFRPLSPVNWAAAVLCLIVFILLSGFSIYTALIHSRNQKCP
jgi:undecaprenol kinase